MGVVEIYKEGRKVLRGEEMRGENSFKRRDDVDTRGREIQERHRILGEEKEM